MGLFSRQIYAALALNLIVLAPAGAQRATDAKGTPYKIPVPKGLKKAGGKLRIRNKATGQSKVIDLADQEFISSDEVRELMDPKTQEFKPEFSVLDFERPKKSPTGGRGTNPQAQQFTNSLVFDQPVWRELGFRSRRLRGGGVVVELDSKGGKILGPARVRMPAPTPDEAARRRGLVEGGDVKKLFDIGWRSLNAKRYDLGVIAFGRVLQRKEFLTTEQLMQAHLGLGISKFHQEGCPKIEEHFLIADRDPKNFEDIAYYRGLCAVEAKRFDKADPLFKELAKRQSTKYGESSRFFIGVVAENLDQLDDAESAYMDTIDFASDQKLVSLAKARLEAVKQAKIQREFERKWFLAAITGALGYDTNVVQLPQSLSPSDYQISKASSPTALGLVYTEIKPPWTRAADLKIKYTFLGLHYFSKELYKTYDIQSHEAGLGAAFSPTASDRVSLGLAYNSVFKGPLGEASEYIVTPSFEAKWLMVNGALDNPTGDMEFGFKVGLVRPRFGPPEGVTALDATANSYVVSYRQNFRRPGNQVIGPGADFEYRPSSGSDNSYGAGTLLGKWDLPIGPDSWQLTANQEAAFQATYYYQSSLKRKDYLLRYTGSVARLWTPWLETRLQFVGTWGLSSESLYRYRRGQLNLLVSAFF